MNLNLLYKKIISLKSLSPSEEVNSLFSELVSTVINNENCYGLNQDEISNLQKICAAAEYELEKYWANRIVNSKNPIQELKQFPYYENYLKLATLEIESLNKCAVHNLHNVLFIGSGPLPMTQIVMAIEFGLKSVGIDTDRTAYSLSKKLIKALNLNDFIKFENTNGEEFERYEEFNLIFVAALAGLESNIKKKIFLKIKASTESGTHVLARSSYGNREFLYKPIDNQLTTIFKEIFRFDPKNDIVNSIVIFRNE